MARQENQALRRKIIAQRKSSANKLDDKDNGRRLTMQNKSQKIHKGLGPKKQADDEGIVDSHDIRDIKE
jgi:hypothetical protein